MFPEFRAKLCSGVSLNQRTDCEFLLTNWNHDADADKDSFVAEACLCRISASDRMSIRAIYASVRVKTHLLSVQSLFGIFDCDDDCETAAANAE